MSIPGIPAGGFKTVGQIVGTNEWLFDVEQSAMAIAAELLSTHTSGAPVVDKKGKFVGFISEFDVLEAIERGKDLNKLKAKEIMNSEHIAVQDSTTIRQAIQIMREKHFLNLPVEQDGKVAYSVTRHDLLRVRIGLGLDIESV
jgi:predicted transcriptional regulator